MGRIRNFSKMNSINDNNTKSARKHVTLNLESETINFFKNMSEESGIPFQAIISHYLTHCKEKNLKLDLSKL